MGWLLAIDLAAFGGGLTLIVAGADHPHSDFGTVGWVLLVGSIALGVLLGIVAVIRRRPKAADQITPQLRVEPPRREALTSYQVNLPVGAAQGPPFASLVVPVTCTRGQLDDLRAEVVFGGLKGGHKVTTRGRWGGADQPHAPFGDWTQFDRITLHDGDTDHLGIAMHYADDGSLWALDSRSWKAPLEQGRHDLRAEGYRLEPVGERISVTVTLRADRLPEQRHSFDIVMVGVEWMLKRLTDPMPEPPPAPAPVAEPESQPKQRRGYNLTVEPADWQLWSRDHHDVNRVAEMLVYLTNHGPVPSPHVTVFVLIDAEHAGRSRPTAAGADSREDVTIPLDFKRRGDAQPKPVGQGLLTLRVMGGHDGKRKLAEWADDEQASAPSPLARLLLTLGQTRGDGNAAELDYRIDNASDHRAWEVHLGFARADGDTLGMPERMAVIEGRAHADVRLSIARSLWDSTDGLQLVINWADDEGDHREHRPLGDASKLPPRRGANS